MFKPWPAHPESSRKTRASMYIRLLEKPQAISFKLMKILLYLWRKKKRKVQMFWDTFLFSTANICELFTLFFSPKISFTNCTSYSVYWINELKYLRDFLGFFQSRLWSSVATGAETIISCMLIKYFVVSVSAYIYTNVFRLYVKPMISKKDGNPFSDGLTSLVQEFHSPLVLNISSLAPLSGIGYSTCFVLLLYASIPDSLCL